MRAFDKHIWTHPTREVESVCNGVEMTSLTTPADNAVRESFNVNKRYQTQIKISCQFYADDDCYRSKRAASVEQLKHELYGDVAAKVREAMMTATNPKTTKILDELLKEIT